MSGACCRFVADVGSNPGRPYDPHSPDNYVTKAQVRDTSTIPTLQRILMEVLGGQASAVFEHPVGSGQMLWLGNQWASGGGAVRNSDLLYWSLLRFDAAGDVLQFTWCALLCFFPLLWLAVLFEKPQP
eukprot:COSAG04_NODE_965_length_9140_cov_5.526048_7_plen_128_part_00